MKKILALAATAALALSVAACTTSSTQPPSGQTGNNLSNQQQQNDYTQLEYVEPLPDFPYSQIRQDLIEWEAIEALGISSTTFFFIPGITHPVFSCPSIGVPMAETDELSNPVIAQWNTASNADQGNNGDSDSIAGVTVGQPDPDGIYQGDTTGSANLCTEGSGPPLGAYNEGYDVAVTAPAYWDPSTGTIKLAGPAVYPVCRVVVVDAAKNQAKEVCTAPASAEPLAPKPSATPAG